LTPSLDPLSAFKKWLTSLKSISGFPPKGTISGSLVVLESLKKEYDLLLDSHTAKGGAQIRGASGSAVQKILVSFGENRQFTTEGGRTNRGLRGDISTLLETLRPLNLDRLSDDERNEILKQMQVILVEKVRDFHKRGKIRLVFSSQKTTHQVVTEILQIAKSEGTWGPVAQHLVGAKLQLRFPDNLVSNRSYSTADQSHSMPGDFYVGNTAVHVTVSPSLSHYQRIDENLAHGLLVYLLVPDLVLLGARQNVREDIRERVSVVSIESFVSQNIDEMAAFSESARCREIARLLKEYNRRCTEVEMDQSLLIEVPQALRDLA
jgi:hypothetical protein